MELRTLDHVGIKVSQLDDAIAAYQELGFKLTRRRVYETVGLEVAFLELGGQRCELLQSLSRSSPIADAPTGLHHLAWQCSGLYGAFARMGSDPAFEVQGPPAVGAHGRPVFFFRVRGCGALHELVEQE